MSQAEEEFLFLVKALKLPAPEREFRFDIERRWRFDFAWPTEKIAAEIDGGVWVRGAHVRGAHFESDCEKMNKAQVLGWRVFRFTPAMVKKGYAMDVMLGLFTVGKNCPRVLSLHPTSRS